MTASAPPRTGRLAALRERVRARPGGRLAWRIGVTLVGALVIITGLVLLPLPGPGWLIIFTGLSLLSTEYRWAAELLTRARRQVRRWTRWIAARPAWFRVLAGVLSVLVIAAIVVAGWIVPRRWL